MSEASQQIESAFAVAGLPEFDKAVYQYFATYLDLISRWNARLNLTSDRNPEQIILRHFAECAFAAQHLPQNVTSLLDYGSGAGFPGLPLAICRPALKITLAEAQGKKAVFLREVVRSLALEVEVFDGRVETLPSDRVFDAVSLRAVEKMEAAIPEALAHARRWLVLFTTRQQLPRDQQGASHSGRAVSWRDPISIPTTEQRILCFGQCD